MGASTRGKMGHDARWSLGVEMIITLAFVVVCGHGQTERLDVDTDPSAIVAEHFDQGLLGQKLSVEEALDALGSDGLMSKGHQKPSYNDADSSPAALTEAEIS